MISVVYGAFVIKTDVKTPGTYRIARDGGKGSMPIALMGNYTSVKIAREDIDRYLVRCNGADDASKTRATRRSK